MSSRLLSLNNQYNQMIDQEKLYHMYQPIFLLSEATCYGYEALLRSPSYNPEELFKFAIEQDQQFELDMVSMKRSIQTFSQTLHPERSKLFINIYPSTLVQSFLLSNLYDFKSELIPHEQMVLEVNESESISDLNLLQTIVHSLKEMGYLIAMDDIGTGMSSLSTLTKVEPDIIKLDKWFSQDLSCSKDKQNYLGRMVRFCGNDVQLVLEGIETAEDLNMAQSLGIDLGQGFFLGRPKYPLQSMLY